jgi:hypothetical protein
MRTTLGQKLHGRVANDAGSAGDDGNPAIETNAIGHAWRFLWVIRLFRIFGARASHGPLWQDYFICGAG